MQPVQGLQMCPQQVSHLQYCPQMYVVSKPTNRRYANFITALKSHTHAIIINHKLCGIHQWCSNWQWNCTWGKYSWWYTSLTVGGCGRATVAALAPTNPHQARNDEISNID